MENALKIINQMLKEGLFRDYAIGGGIAAIFYIEPITTFDLDIFIFLPESPDLLVSLTPLYEWLTKHGFKCRNEQVIIDGIPVQFIPLYNDLVKDAVINAVEKPYGNIMTRVVRPEYLIAIMLQTNRPKDKDRLIKFLEESEFSDELLNGILLKYKLSNAFKMFKKLYYEK